MLLHLAFYTKVPAWPMHSWLTEAHVESTTEGSVLLAGVYLKVGVTGSMPDYCIQTYARSLPAVCLCSCMSIAPPCI